MVASCYIKMHKNVYERKDLFNFLNFKIFNINIANIISQLQHPWQILQNIQYSCNFATSKYLNLL